VVPTAQVTRRSDPTSPAPSKQKKGHVMIRSPKLLVVLAVAAAALVPVIAPEPSSARGTDTTTFKGRFVCGDEPLAGAQVELLGEPRVHSSLLGTDFRVGFTVRGTRYANSDGAWSFTVPRTEDTNYYVQVSLDDGRGTIVTHYPNTSATAVVPGSGGTNFNDVPVQDYHSQAYPGEECGLWLELKNAYGDYARLMGKRPPYGPILAQYDAPNRGTPYAAYTTIVWPKGYPTGGQRVRHEFAHTIRNASLGSEDAFLDEVSQEDFRVRKFDASCTRTTPQYAFHEGWAEFWAGDFLPAPNCRGVKPDDPSVEGDVAWTLTRLEHNCTAASRKRMVEVLLAQGKTIHSLADFVRALGVGSASCLGAPLDPTAVARSQARPPVSDELWMRDLKAGLTSVRKRQSVLGKLLPGADRAAATARCPNPPCLDAIARKLAPSLIRGQVAAAHAAASTLQTALTIDATSLRGKPTRKFLDSVTLTPPTLAKRMAKIGVDSIGKALAAARPLATRDHSSPTRSVLAVFRSQRSALLHVADSGAGVHAYHRAVQPGCVSASSDPLVAAFAAAFGIGCYPGWSEAQKKTSTVPTVYSHEVTFDRFPDGTVITTQPASRGAVFGSAGALGFHGTLPKYVCPGGPTVSSGRWATTPVCSASDIGVGFSYTGTLAKLRFPARSVFATVGATQAIPGGLAAELDGFDAAGAVVARTAVLVGSSTNGQKAIPDDYEKLTLTPSLHVHAIVFVALYVNHPVSSVGLDSKPPQLAMAILSWIEKPR
jgi:hypothetical protein